MFIISVKNEKGNVLSVTSSTEEMAIQRIVGEMERHTEFMASNIFIDKACTIPASDRIIDAINNEFV